MQALILILHVLVAIAIIALVLLQHGRGADVGASFGSGASNTMFGSAGSVPFLMKLTAACALIFFTTSIVLSHMASHVQEKTDTLNMPVMPVTSTTNIAPTAPTEKNKSLPASQGFSFVPSEKK